MTHNADLQDAIFEVALDDDPLETRGMPAWLQQDLIAQMKARWEPWHFRMTESFKNVVNALVPLVAAYRYQQLDHHAEGRMLLARHRRRRHR